MTSLNVGKWWILVLWAGLLANCTLPIVCDDQSPSSSSSQISVPKEMKFVRVRLGKKIMPGAGQLGQTITSYFMNVDIGTPPKLFKMLVDVNARENFVPHYLKLGLIYSRMNYRNGYSKKDSSTSEKEEAETLTIAYNGCTLSGKAYTDRFELGDVVESYKRAEYKQRFLAMSSASNDRIVKHGVDGVMALNPWSVSATGSELLTASLARADLMGELKFALHLVDPEQDESELTGGELILGAVNSTRFSGALRFHQVRAQHAWEVPLAGVMLGGHTIRTQSSGVSALLSTSSNGITGPASSVKEILELLGAEGGDSAQSQSKLYTIDCDRRSNAPELSFFFEEARYSIPPSAYIKVRPAGTFRKATCYLELYSNYAEDNKWELGTNFLSKFYTVFDVYSRRVALGSLHSRED